MRLACSSVIFLLPVVIAFFFQAEDGIRDKLVTGVQTCALPIWAAQSPPSEGARMWVAGGTRDAPFTPSLEADDHRVGADEALDPRLAEARLAHPARSEERRVGKECRSRGSPSP